MLLKEEYRSFTDDIVYNFYIHLLEKAIIYQRAIGYFSIIERALVKSITESKNYFEEERLNLLTTLIAQNRLDIKMVFHDKIGKFGIYHEKVGSIYYKDQNVVAFTSSLNETAVAFSHKL